MNTRALAEVFALISEGNPRKTAGYKYSVTVSVVEIYNETVGGQGSRARGQNAGGVACVPLRRSQISGSLASLDLCRLFLLLLPRQIRDLLHMDQNNRPK